VHACVRECVNGCMRACVRASFFAIMSLAVTMIEVSPDVHMLLPVPVLAATMTVRGAWVRLCVRMRACIIFCYHVSCCHHDRGITRRAHAAAGAGAGSHDDGAWCMIVYNVLLVLAATMTVRGAWSCIMCCRCWRPRPRCMVVYNVRACLLLLQ